jgi:hypothetical protein
MSRLLIALVVPRETRGRYRQAHGRQRVSIRTGKVVQARSAQVSARQERRVRAADRHRCVAQHLATREYPCAGEPGGRWFHEIDHRIPWIAGGITWLPNLFLLCFFHNQTKCNYNVDRDGYVHYRRSSYGGVYDPVLAAAVLAAERKAARNPLRWLRAWVLGV